MMILWVMTLSVAVVLKWIYVAMTIFSSFVYQNLLQKDQICLVKNIFFELMEKALMWIWFGIGLDMGWI